MRALFHGRIGRRLLWLRLRPYALGAFLVAILGTVGGMEYRDALALEASRAELAEAERDQCRVMQMIPRRTMWIVHAGTPREAEELLRETASDLDQERIKLWGRK